MKQATILICVIAALSAPASAGTYRRAIDLELQQSRTDSVFVRYVEGVVSSLESDG